MRYVIIDATNMFEHSISLETQKKLNSFKTERVTTTYSSNDYKATTIYTVVEINSLEELNKLTKAVGEVIVNHYARLPGGVLDEVDGSILIYNDYIE